MSTNKILGLGKVGQATNFNNGILWLGAEQRCIEWLFLKIHFDFITGAAPARILFFQYFLIHKKLNIA